jgi:antitoxin (DNA-binding transcriptional repressor) of toxin-antitoxin stability system
MDRLRQCPSNPNHLYSSHLAECDECELARKSLGQFVQPAQATAQAAPVPPVTPVPPVPPPNSGSSGGVSSPIIPQWLGWMGAAAALCFTLFVFQSVMGFMNPSRQPVQPSLPAITAPPALGSSQAANREADQKAEAPDVLGKTLDETRQAIEAAGLILKQSSPDIESEYEIGKVAQQVPASGTSLNKGEEVTVTLSKGPQADLVSVPSLSGMDAEQAESAARSARMEFKTEDAFSDRPAGELLSQSPGAGQQVPAGSQLTATYSKGRRPPNSEELSYLATASHILTTYNRQTKENGLEVASELQKLSIQRPPVPTPENLAPFANLMERQHDQTRSVITEFEGLEPPARYRELHQAIMEYAGASAEVLKEAEDSLRRADRGGLRQMERSGAQIEREWKPKLSSLLEAAGLSAPKFQDTGELVPI